MLSTVPAIGTAMLGNLAGRWIGERRPLTERLAGLSAAGALAMMAGLMWHWSFPINKSLWTSSYVLFTAGMAARRAGDGDVDRRLQPRARDSRSRSSCTASTRSSPSSARR